jgi:hypothetical protein
VVERFTRVNADTIHYEVTIEDPAVYTAPWKVAIPLQRDDNYRIYEYACHEGAGPRRCARQDPVDAVCRLTARRRCCRP